jgi:IS5 family transposase
MLADLHHLIEAVGQLVAQTRLRLAGEIPPAKTRRVSLHDDDARPIRKGSLATPTQFGYTGQVTDNRDGIILDYEIEPGMPPDAPRLAPAVERIITAIGRVPDVVTADRGYGQVSVDAELEALGVKTVAILRKGQPGAARRSVEAGGRLRRAHQVAHRCRRPHRRPQASARMGSSPDPKSRRCSDLVWLGDPLPQRHQDRRNLLLTDGDNPRRHTKTLSLARPHASPTCRQRHRTAAVDAAGPTSSGGSN